MPFQFRSADVPRKWVSPGGPITIGAIAGGKKGAALGGVTGTVYYLSTRKKK